MFRATVPQPQLSEIGYRIFGQIIKGGKSQISVINRVRLSFTKRAAHHHPGFLGVSPGG